MFISEAWAQGAGGGSMFGGEGMMQFLPLILIFVVFYFLLIRPQQKKMKAHREMLSAVRRGDRIVSGGIIGQVVKVISDAEIDVQIADGVKVRMLKAAVTDVIARGEPIKGAKKGEDVEAEDEIDEDAPVLPRPAPPDVKRGGGFGGLFGPKK